MDGSEIELTIDQKSVANIVCGKSSHKMSALLGSDFPEIPSLKSEKGFTVSQSVLKRMMSKVMYAMGVNDQRLILNGTYLRVTNEKLMLVTCDSFKLAKCVRTTDIGNENRDKEDVSFLFIIPNKTVNELYKLLVSDDEDAIVKIFYMRKYIIVELNGIIFFSRLVEGEYIDFNRIIIKNHTVKISMDKEDLLSALERAALVTEERIAGNTRSHVKLDVNGHLLAISANSAIGSTYDEVEIAHEGGDMFIAFNNRYLIDSVRACRADRLTISLSSALTSINIEPEENEEGCEDIFMLLPVRMKDQI
jgi:DNA polymerase-3 subunit beta